MNASRIAAVALLAAAAAVPGAPAPRAAMTPVAAAAPAAVAVPEDHVHDHTHAHGHSHTHVAPVKAAAKPAAVALPAPVRRVAAAPGALFRTPEAAMRFLVTAYNAHDEARMKKVTTPEARTHLWSMRDYAPELRLTSCTPLDTGAYDCEFTHSLKDSRKHTGFATFRVGPAAKPGWYMTVLVECGDGEGG